MIIPDRKKAVTVILSKMRGDGSEKSQEVKSEESLDPHNEALKTISEDILQAISDKSAMDLSTALSALVREIQAQDLEQDQEMED